MAHVTPPSSPPLTDATTQGGYQLLEKAVAKVVLRSIPTLRSISVKGRRGKDSRRVAAILAEMVPSSVKLMKDRVAPRLTRVELAHGADGLVKLGKVRGGENTMSVLTCTLLSLPREFLPCQLGKLMNKLENDPPCAHAKK